MLKQGTDTSIKNGAGTDSELKLESTKATVSTGITKVVLTETSPGDIEFIVATDSSGTTAFTAMHIDGAPAASEARVVIKQGALLALEGSSSSLATLRSTNSTDVTLNMPSSSGTIALRTEVPTSVTDLTDVTSAGSGAIITSSERTKLTGIATGATLNSPDSILLNRSYHTGTQTASTISDFDTEVSNNSSVAANTAKVGYTDSAVDTRIGLATILDLAGTPSSYVANNLLQVNSAGNGIVMVDKRQPYSKDEVVDDQNRIVSATLTTSSNKVVDWLNDTVATASGASAKNFLAWYDGTTITIEGMVDIGAQPPQGASAGSPLWLGASGAIVSIAPTTATHYSRIIGYHVGTLQSGNGIIYFSPSKDWVQID